MRMKDQLEDEASRQQTEGRWVDGHKKNGEPGLIWRDQIWSSGRVVE